MNWAPIIRDRMTKSADGPAGWKWSPEFEELERRARERAAAAGPAAGSAAESAARIGEQAAAGAAGPATSGWGRVGGFFQRAGRDVVKPFLARHRGLLYGTGALASMYGGFHLARQIREKAQAKSNFERMMRATPTLAAEDPQLVQSRFRTLQHVAPNLAMDPLVAGSIVRQWVEYPTVNASALKDVVSVEKDVRRELGLAGPLAKVLTGWGMS